MYRRDYLMRMIEQFSVSMGQVLFQRQNRRFAEAMELLTQAMKQLLGLNSKMVRALSVKDIIGLLSTNGYFDVGKGLLLSDMLVAEGDVLNEAGEEREGTGCLLKSLELLLHIRRMEEAEQGLSDVDERIAAVLPKVQHVRMTAFMREVLTEYYDDAGLLSKAEDMLFFLLEDDPGNAAAMERGMAMMERWLSLPPEAIEKGGLSAEEIRESYDLLNKMKHSAS
ncbi:DUF6483 family protein [Paenibacillus sp. 32352]|uniref:DUF6483 family protein n=1 Tax=Paenibacillus sp. 32352 TaxID=1969111 RepID=UPI0009AE092F|nr:DUF6483 family protein [Paenibacillus sp. 32352]